MTYDETDSLTSQYKANSRMTKRVVITLEADKLLRRENFRNSGPLLDENVSENVAAAAVLEQHRKDGKQNTWHVLPETKTPLWVRENEDFIVISEIESGGSIIPL